MRHTLPRAAKGQVIGLLGGSFDPPHRGHLHVSQVALKRFGLDRVWWMVSPGNPLKTKGPASLQKRMAACRELVQHPRIEVTDIEDQIGTRYTAETLQKLFDLYPQQRFVWLMGADNLASFHHWGNWHWIMENVPVGVIARPGDRISARLSPAARQFQKYRLRGNNAQYLSHRETPSWCFINAPMMAISSTELRAQGQW
ncbi:nicotinate-nucleotide adenylyltransferase [Cochlodiniinecator piscidefendens]|uniref:nicotinate-nucleotide adenylyltransferase n=1 Tax=Cochlodiniinecator piscidefendens TaxID=2715756 RepID=UPI00140849EE|nr:nicotinate-nucleotide adenylyltransferase [Cochlodiniinecator piscidefendens]